MVLIPSFTVQLSVNSNIRGMCVYRPTYVLLGLHYINVEFILVLTMATIKTKRARAPDFSEEEVAVIRDSFVKHSKTLSAKHTNEVTQRTKNDILLGIVNEVNALGVAERSLQSIKDKWQTMKKNVKEKITRSMRDKKKESEQKRAGERTLRWMTLMSLFASTIMRKTFSKSLGGIISGQS